MSYSLAAQCGSEMIGSALVIYIGESIIANELLAKTKGRMMGWGFVALGFGLSFGVVIMMFGYISAHLNPATCMALWVVGKLTFTEFLALSGSEFAGMFLGAILVWLHYLPHFKTVPEPAPHDTSDLLLRSRDMLAPDALNIASYNTRVSDMRHVGGVTANLRRVIDDLKYYLKTDTVAEHHHVPDELLVDALGRDEMKAGADGLGLRRRSVQVCDVHRRLKDMSIEEYAAKLKLNGAAALAHGPEPTGANDAVPRADASAEEGPFKDSADGSVEPLRSSSVPNNLNGRPAVVELTTKAATAALAPAGKAVALAQHHKGTPGDALASGMRQVHDMYKKHIEKHEERVGKLYDAAVVADQNAKLSIFATRPAIYTPVFNFITELMSTVALVFGALMMYARREQLYQPEKDLFRSYEGMWVGFLVFVLILGLGGPTGIAANPARDFAPRVAHFLLPIPGKGSSEWWYSWIPFFAPFFGGAIAGGFYKAVQLMNHSNVSGSFPSAAG